MRLSREMWWMIATMIVANIAGNMFYPLLPLYLKSLGASTQDVGFYFTLQAALAILFRILGGWISDNIGRLPSIAIGAGLGMIGYVIFGLAPTWIWTIAAALVSESAASLVAPSFQAYIAEQSGEGSVSRTFGLVNGLYVICQIIGPLLGGFLAEYYGFQTMIWVAIAIYAIAAVGRIWMARHAKFKLQSLDARAFGREVWQMLGLFMTGGILLWLFLADGLIDAGSQLSLPFLPGFMVETANLGESTFGALFAFMSLVIALTMLPGGMFADRFGEQVSMVVGILLFAATWLTVVLMPHTLFVFGVCFALAGVAQAFIQPALSSLISKATPAGSRGLVWGVFLTALGVMAIPAPYIGGWLYTQVAPEATFILSAVSVLVAIPLVWWKLRLPTPTVSAAPVTEVERVG